MNTALIIQNLKCGGCSKQIISKLNQIEGVSNPKVDVDHCTVDIDYTDEEQLDKVVQTLKQMGYPLIAQENTLLDKSKSYLSCMIGRTKSETTTEGTQ